MRVARRHDDDRPRRGAYTTDGVLHWSPLRESLNREEASNLIDRLERLEEHIGGSRSCEITTSPASSAARSSTPSRRRPGISDDAGRAAVGWERPAQAAAPTSPSAAGDEGCARPLHPQGAAADPGAAGGDVRMSPALARRARFPSFASSSSRARAFSPGTCACDAERPDARHQRGLLLEVERDAGS